MIRLSRMADYAVVIMSTIAVKGDTQVSAHQLSDDTHLGTATVSKIVKALAQAGLLLSERGARGGYRLARESHAITVGDIIAAVDGPIALTDCIEDSPGECSIESACPARHGWQKINDAVKRALNDVSLAEIAGPAPLMRSQHGTQSHLNEN